MISFFKINDPLRLIGVFVLFVLIRLIFFFQQPPLLIPELNWLIIGEKLDQGGIMYVDVWDSIAPLSALTYWVLHKLVGNSIVVYHILAMALVFLQAAFFNYVLLRKNLYNEKNYLPALFYVLFACSTFDILILSPALMSLTFLLLVIRNILSLNDDAFDNEIFKTGIYLGIAILIYLPNFIFLVFIAIGFALFRTASARQYLLFIYGISFIFSFFVIYYFWIGKANYFFQNYLITIFDLNWSSFLSWQTILFVLFFPIFFLTIALLRVFNETAFINFQSNTQLLMLIWFALSILTNLFAPSFATYQLILIAPMFSFFVTYFFLLYKKKFAKEILFLIALLSMSISGYWSCFPINPLSKYIDYESIKVNKPKAFEVNAKKILVLGNNISYYLGNQLATPYLNWELSQAHFANLEYYSGMIAVYENFQKDLPEIIVDEANMGELVFGKIPILQKSYIKQGNLYLLKQEARK
ncbi:MAG: hypothetical protein MUE81_14715 [Thermoflexibacter sp.]|jgi:hypothetical protein|nr:hypothetical protein [Thermoflexibacter sp.]